MGDKQKKSWGAKITRWLPNLYYIGTLVSLCFILAQVYYAKHSIIESSEWEKAKITIENVTKFQDELNKSPLSDEDVLSLGDKPYPDFSTKEGWEATDTLRVIYEQLFNYQVEMRKDFYQLLYVFEAFAYPIIMGYANEEGSFQMTIKQYYAYGSFIMPYLFHHYPNMGHHAKLLFSLWRIKSEIMFIDELMKQDQQTIDIRMEYVHFLCFEEKKVSATALKRYRKTLEKKVKEKKHEIKEFRKQAMD